MENRLQNRPGVAALARRWLQVGSCAEASSFAGDYYASQFIMPPCDFIKRLHQPTYHFR
jgi:hypothetical protein